MIKEIFEQPQSIENAFRGRINEETFSAHLGGLNLSEEQLRDIHRVFILGCGTALHAGKVAEYMIEAIANIPVETDDASEFRYRHNPIDKDTIFFAVSQSGETADTLAAMREAKRKGFPCLGICNVIGSSIARESDGGTYIHSGPEISVAATKSFTSKLVVFALLALLLGRNKYLSAAQGSEIIQAIKKLPEQATRLLQQNDNIQKIAQKYLEVPRYLCFGRLYNFPLALETALKIKEITYKGAQGYPSSELKHGIIALVDQNTPSIFFAPKDSVYEKNVNNMSEVKARGGKVIAITTEGNEEIKSVADDVIYVPQTLEFLQPILNIIPMQLFAYHTAVGMGRDVDKPRNLAKSVTVE
jgi:glucosamine--fructose-6-phosphate aminotransferase (isomerizing)